MRQTEKSSMWNFLAKYILSRLSECKFFLIRTYYVILIVGNKKMKE